MAQAAKEAIFIKGFINELVIYDCPIVMYNDNQSAQKLMANPIYHSRTKHIKVKYHFTRETVMMVL